MKFNARIRVPRGGLAGLLAGAMALALAAPHTAAASTPAADAAPVAAARSTVLSTTEASARAKATGKPVLATAMTTATREITANANGSFTMTISPAPVRVEQHGTWVALNAALHANTDGTLSPAAVPGALTLSGGGTSALATMTSNGQQLSVTLPVNLPRPAVSGATATYPNVLPGTDLKVTATSQGGFSDVFVVNTPAAAADPRLATLLKARITASKDLSLSTDTAGDFFAAMPNGHSAFTAPVATAWDSATTDTAPISHADSTANRARAVLIPTSVHTPLASTVAGPGRHAHQAGLSATFRDGTLSLDAPAALTDAPATDYPLYYDPAYGPAVANFATVNSAFPGQPYINGSGTSGDMQVGYNGDLEGCNPCFNARSFVTLNMSGLPSNAQKITAEVNFWDSWSASCTAEELDLWETSPINTSSTNPTTWTNQPTWNSQIGKQTESKGWVPASGSSSCPAGGIGYDISSAVQSVVNAHGPTLTLGLRIPAAQESNNDDNWKQLNGNNSNQTETTASVSYDVPPNTPTRLYMSPATNCSSANPTVLGDTGVTLYAPVSTSTGANLTTTFDFYNTSAPTTNLLTSGNGIASDTYTGASGGPAVMVLPESFIKTQSGTSLTTFAWKAITSDGNLPSDWSAPCTFKVDNSRPGAPTVVPATSPPTGSSDCPVVPNNATEPVGTSCAFTFTPPKGATISGYTYQVNNSKPTQVNATAAVTVEFNLPGIVNTLTVSALSPGGNIGSATTVWFDGTAYSPPETDGDLTGNGIPDLIVAGNTTGDFPPGLWLAQGQRNGSVDSYAQNIGTNGLGFNTTPSASDWNGSQAITGNFCGQGTQDVLAYFPGAYNATTNPNGGGGAIMCGTGTSQPLQQAVSGTQYTFGQNQFSYLDLSNTSYNASVVANAGTFDSADGTGDFQLFYAVVPTGTGSGVLTAFAETEPNSVTNIANIALSTTPTGGTDWNNWTITTAQDERDNSSGVLTTYTDMYLWDSATGDLYLWAGVTPNSTSLDSANGLTYTPYKIASGWNTGKSLTLRAADIAGDGNPGLWATDTTSDSAGGTTTAYIPPATLEDNPPLTPTASTITTATHSWQFADIPTDGSGTAISSTADGNGTLNLTQPSGITGAQWNTGDLFSPDVRFTGSSGDLQTPGEAIDLTHSFTISFWTRPETNGTMALSESGSSASAYPGLMIDPTPSGWDFYLAKDDGSEKWGGDTITGGNVDFGVWTHIQATYNATTHVMSLYVDDTFVATGTHAVPSGTATGPLTLGANIDNGTYTSWYTGQIANLQTWSGTALAPNQPASSASYHQSIEPERILDTRQNATHPNSNIVENGTPLGAGNTLTIPIVGDKVTPIASGAPTTIPTSATAVAIDVTLVSETANGNLTAYADGTQRPTTSATNYAANTTITGYEIIPIGQDGKINLYNSSTGTTDVLADITGYFTSNPNLTGDQTYTPLPTAVRLFDTRSNITKTNLSGTGPVAANTGFTVDIDNTDGIAPKATAVAINLTAISESGNGYLQAYPTGQTPAADTSLTYTGSQIASLSADVPVGANGTITVYNDASATDIIGDVTGYYTTTTTGQVYHTVNPTRLVDTRSGIGSTTGAAAVPALTAYTLSGADTAQITTATSPTLALMLTITQPTEIGAATAYPSSDTPPGTSNINWAANQTIANLALSPTDSSGSIDVLNQSNGTTQLIIDCSGYFANY